MTPKDPPPTSAIPGEFQRHQAGSGCRFKIVGPQDPEYNADRVIADSRFNLFPALIAYCENTEHVACCLNFCRTRHVPFRVRSGGHQHEGMCSADGVLLIDLSRINSIEYLDADRTRAWIPVGKRLKDVYSELESHSRIIPGGSCDSVHVGGVVQGGGWGPYIRRLGLSCDNIVEAEIVLASGQVVRASAETPYDDLFWAIRGGGGGNFGVVTRFLFKLTILDGTLTTFNLNWKQANMLPVTRAWMRESPRFPDGMSTFCRVKTVHNAVDAANATLVAGVYFGPKEEARAILQPLYDIAEPEPSQPGQPAYTEQHFPPTPPPGGAPAVALHAQARAGLATLMQPPAKGAPTQTCDGPHPHKVSSAFPRDGGTDALAEKIVAFLSTRIPSDNASTYLSLHGFGGAVKREPVGGRAFPYKDKEFLLQFQAWWSDPHDVHTQEYIDWIEDFRGSLSENIEGAFINFPDRLLVPNPDELEGRLRLLEIYYAGNLWPLRTIKSKYDPDNHFSFGMSIPPA